MIDTRIKPARAGQAPAPEARYKGAHERAPAMSSASDTNLAALLFRPSEVSERALSRGFAVALAGWDVPAPRLGIAALPGIPGWSAAFYTSGAAQGEDELDHVVELF
jgi:hypothetical protein